MKLNRTRALLIHSGILIVLTAGMFWVKQEFYIDEVISHPQFGSEINFGEALRTIDLNKKTGLFYGFFVLDLFWSFALLTIMPHFLFRLQRSWSSIRWVGTIVFLAWLVDAFEGVIYTSGSMTSLLQEVLYIKLAMYGMAIVSSIAIALIGRSNTQP